MPIMVDVIGQLMVISHNSDKFCQEGGYVTSVTAETKQVTFKKTYNSKPLTCKLVPYVNNPSGYGVFVRQALTNTELQFKCMTSNTIDGVWWEVSGYIV